MDTETAIKLAIEKFRFDKYQTDYLDPSSDIRGIDLQEGSGDSRGTWTSTWRDLAVKITYICDDRVGEIVYNVHFDWATFTIKVEKVDL